MGEAVTVTCLVAGDLCMFERKIDLWRIDEARQQKRERYKAGEVELWAASDV